MRINHSFKRTLFDPMENSQLWNHRCNRHVMWSSRKVKSFQKHFFSSNIPYICESVWFYIRIFRTNCPHIIIHSWLYNRVYFIHFPTTDDVNYISATESLYTIFTKINLDTSDVELYTFYRPILIELLCVNSMWTVVFVCIWKLSFLIFQFSIEEHR